jgi:putative SOS response-associated peptidase YedK
VCGRVVQSRPLDELADAYDAPADETARMALRPRYNVAPTDPLATIVEDRAGQRRLTAQRWGLLPPTPRRTKNPLINARAETIRVNPLFRAALERRRCLVPVDGFYEWQRLADRRQPYFIRPLDGGPLTLAGIWAPRGETPAGAVVGTCSIVTTTPLSEISWLHDRMPLILTSSQWTAWLDPRTPGSVIDDLLHSATTEALETHEVALLVNNVRNDGPELIARVARQPLLGLTSAVEG